MTKNRKIALIAIIVLVLVLAVTIVALSASKTRCKSYYSGGVRVAKLCYTMNATWHEPQEQVKCNNDGNLELYTYKAGWSWTYKVKGCSPKYYSSTARGVGAAYLNGNLRYVGIIAYGDRVNHWATYTR